jgi:hypothetical protein
MLHRTPIPLPSIAAGELGRSLPMDIPEEVVAAVIGAIPALLAPLIGSFRQRCGFAQKAKEVEVAEKRARLLNDCSR